MLEGSGVGCGLLREGALEKAEECADKRRLEVRDKGQHLLLEHSQSLRDVVLEKLSKLLLNLRGGGVAEPGGGGKLFDPGRDDAAPLEALVGRDVEDTRTRHGGGSRVREVTDLEDHAHVGLQGDALVGGESEHPVVVHYRVHGLDPVCIKVAIEEDPLGKLVVDLAEVAHDGGEKAVLPVTGGEVDVTVQVLRVHDLGVDISEQDGSAALSRAGLREFDLPGLLEGQGAGGLSRGGRSHGEDAVADLEELIKLDALEHKSIVRVQAEAVACLDDAVLELLVDLSLGVKTREEISEEAMEDDLINLDNLGDVKVAKGAHEHGVLGGVRVGALKRSSDNEHGLDGAKAPVVVLLLG
mmetsp:Transcript_14244/g.29070  ORF Transcript_14244/g.29070 Transcript_14244/m.29070 type:complete len:355 (-) Transcript_14244:2823-3887(-)